MPLIIYHAIVAQSSWVVLWILINSNSRNSFFSHLVDVLGPDDFLATVCMLLIDKVANRVIRQNADEVQGSVALPISILQHYSNPVQISVSRTIIVAPLWTLLTFPSGAYRAFEGKSASG